MTASFEFAGQRLTAPHSARIGDCTGCIMRDASFRECAAACAQAKSAGLPDCDDIGPNGKPYIYVLDKSDPRQVDLVAQQESGAASS